MKKMLLIIPCIFLIGCSSFDSKIQEQRDAVQAEHDAVTAQIQDQQKSQQKILEQKATLPPDDPKIVELVKKFDDLNQKVLSEEMQRIRLQTQISVYDNMLATSHSVQDPQSFLAFIPPPYGQLAGVAFAALAGIAETKRRKTKKNAKALVKNIDTVKETDGTKWTIDKKDLRIANGTGLSNWIDKVKS